MTNKTSTSAPEKRDFFRINHDVIFEYHIVDGDAAETSSPQNHFDDSPALELLNQMRKIDKDNQKILSLLKDKNRLLTDYLQSLSTKIDAVTRFCLYNQTQQNEGQSTTRVNISEGGIAFSANKAIYKDSFMVLRLIFLPSFIHVVTFAKVVRCQHNEEVNNIAAKFHRMPDRDRQEISRQIYRAQVQRKQAKQNQEQRNPDS